MTTNHHSLAADAKRDLNRLGAGPVWDALHEIGRNPLRQSEMIPPDRPFGETGHRRSMLDDEDRITVTWDGAWYRVDVVFAESEERATWDRIYVEPHGLDAFMAAIREAW